MPKKSTTARTTTQRSKPKAQKSFELVRLEVQTLPETATVETTSATAVAAPKELEQSVNTVPLPEAKNISRETRKSVNTLPKTGRVSEEIKKSVDATPIEDNTKEEIRKSVPAVPKGGSAAARLAERRLAAQKIQQQRAAASLLTGEHFSYVRKDLITIAILAAIMFAAIIILYFTIGKP
jgi:hypothetical protein